MCVCVSAIDWLIIAGDMFMDWFFIHLKMAPLIVQKRIKQEPTRLIPIVEHDLRTIGFILIDVCWLFDVSWWWWLAAVVDVVDDLIGVGLNDWSQAGILDRFVCDEIFNCSSKRNSGVRVYLRV